MNLILYLSEAVIPILVLLIVGNGLMHRQHVYEDFLEGAKAESAQQWRLCRR